MKLAIKNNKVIARVTDEYVPPEGISVITEPEGFDMALANKYELVNSELTRMPPEFVTMRQARLALREAGLLASVNSFIDSISDPVIKERTFIEWEYALIVNRNSPLVIALASELNLTTQQLDALFIAADSIPD